MGGKAGEHSPTPLLKELQRDTQHKPIKNLVFAHRKQIPLPRRRARRILQRELNRREFMIHLFERLISQIREILACFFDLSFAGQPAWAFREEVDGGYEDRGDDGGYYEGHAPGEGAGFGELEEAEFDPGLQDVSDACGWKRRFVSEMASRCAQSL